MVPTKLNITMRQIHRPGEKMFVDYSGKRLPITNRETSEISMAEIFVAVMGASSKTYVEAGRSQQEPDWLLANAAGQAQPLLQFFDDGQGQHGPHALPALPAEQAQNALKALLHLRSQGLQAPLLFAPYSGWAIYNAEADKREKAGFDKWNGSERSWARLE